MGREAESAALLAQQGRWVLPCTVDPFKMFSHNAKTICGAMSIVVA